MKYPRLFLFINLLLIPICLLASLFYAFANTTHTIPADKTTIYVNSKGTGLMQLAYGLHRQHFISHPQLFIWLVKLRADTKHLQAGEYDFGRNPTPNDILRKMTHGEVIIHRMTFVEGWTLQQMLDAMIHDSSIQIKVTTPEQLQLQFAPLHLSAEGLFFPSTYQFVKDETNMNLLKRSQAKMNDILSQEWQARGPSLPYQDPYQALIAASLIEKETGIDAERYLVASVLVNRLNKRMPLQMDPSIIYSTGRADHVITKEDLQSKSPYNTYLNQGLPPTPIANPGRLAIHAALHPANTSYLYFVADGKGGHVFSNTLQEHDLAVKKYREMP